MSAKSWFSTNKMNWFVHNLLLIKKGYVAYLCDPVCFFCLLYADFVINKSHYLFILLIHWFMYLYIFIIINFCYGVDKSYIYLSANHNLSLNLCWYGLIRKSFAQIQFMNGSWQSCFCDKSPPFLKLSIVPYVQFKNMCSNWFGCMYFFKHFDIDILFQFPTPHLWIWDQHFAFMYAHSVQTVCSKLISWFN